MRVYIASKITRTSSGVLNLLRVFIFTVLAVLLVGALIASPSVAAPSAQQDTPTPKWPTPTPVPPTDTPTPTPIPPTPRPKPKSNPQPTPTPVPVLLPETGGTPPGIDLLDLLLIIAALLLTTHWKSLKRFRKHSFRTQEE